MTRMYTIKKIKLTKVQKKLQTKDYCPKARDRLHSFKNVFSDDVGADRECEKCGYGFWDPYY